MAKLWCLNVVINVYCYAILDRVHLVRNKSTFVAIAIKQIQQHADVVLKVGHVENYVRNYCLVSNIDANKYCAISMKNER